MKIKRILLYLLYIGLAMGVTTTAVLAISGKCFKHTHGKIEYVACDCHCEEYEKTPDGRCTNCWHYEAPVADAARASRVAAMAD